MLLLAGSGPLALSPGRLAQAYAARGLRNEALIPSAFPFRLSPERREALLFRLRGLGPSVARNEDLRPAAYFLAWRVWLAKFVSPGHLLGLFSLAAAALWGLARLWKLRRALLSRPENLAVFSLGFAGMGLEVILLLAFQIASGALYWRLGLLLSMFMAGLALGSGLTAVLDPPPAGARKGLALLLSLFSIGGFALAWTLPWLAQLDPSPALKIFSLLLVLDGAAVGAAYALACRQEPARVYGVDLWGSALGAFFTGAFLVPLAGMRLSLALCAAAALPPIVLLLWPPRKSS